MLRFYHLVQNIDYTLRLNPYSWLQYLLWTAVKLEINIFSTSFTWNGEEGKLHFLDDEEEDGSRSKNIEWTGILSFRVFFSAWCWNHQVLGMNFLAFFGAEEWEDNKDTFHRCEKQGRRKFSLFLPTLGAIALFSTLHNLAEGQ